MHNGVMAQICMQATEEDMAMVMADIMEMAITAAIEIMDIMGIVGTAIMGTAIMSTVTAATVTADTAMDTATEIDTIIRDTATTTVDRMIIPTMEKMLAVM